MTARPPKAPVCVGLENARLALRLVPEAGARVVSLVDRRSGREWIVPGPLPKGLGPRARFLDHASGWDECFPSVAVCRHPAWGGALRDHGVLWARPWRLERRTPGRLVLAFEGAGVTFRRSVILREQGLLLRYETENTSQTSRPWLWSQHCLLACEPGDRLITRGLGPWRTAEGQPVSPAAVDPVRGPEAAVAGKLFAAVRGRAEAELRGPDGGGLRFSWHAASAPHAGLWYSYGGWPTDAPLYQLAIEPTTLAANALPGAGAARLAPGATHRFEVELTLT